MYFPSTIWTLFHAKPVNAPNQIPRIQSKSFYWLAYTKNCTNENSPLYSIMITIAWLTIHHMY